MIKLVSFCTDLIYRKMKILNQRTQWQVDRYCQNEKLTSEINNLNTLHWKNPKTSVWVNKVLRLLKNEFGEDSDYYNQFYSTTHGPVAVSSGTPDSEFQRRHLERLERYQGYLEAFLEEIEEKGPIQESKFPSELKLHPKIKEASEKLFQNKHYSQAIFEAIKTLEKEIKTKSRVRNKIGVDLVNHVFQKEHPIIAIIEGEEQEHVDEREGFRFLYMGAFLGIKNLKSHSIQDLDDPFKTVEYLSFISLLMKRLDESTVNA